MNYRPACYDSDLNSEDEELYGIQNNKTVSLILNSQNGIAFLTCNYCF